ncbi:MAG: hypothetical protein JWM25_29 [Thermoleophilia bacterium]|nr:hypothetical protein [Thermoleophilia bacterium]
MRTSAPRPTLPAPDPASAPDDDDDPQVTSTVDATLVDFAPDMTVVQPADRGSDADFGSNDHRAFLPQAQGIFAASAVGGVGQQQFPPASLTQQRGNASYATGFDRAPAFADVARSTGLTGAVAAYAAMRDR